MAGMSTPASGYKFNSMQEIKSHSSILYNERLAILFFQLDMTSIELNTNYDLQNMYKVRAILKQIYKNIRTLIRNNPTMRATLNIETKDEGVYITDVMWNTINKMIHYCEVTEQFSERRIYIITEQLNNLEMLIKDILQYYHYFIRPDFRQKPDIEIATEVYKQMADKKTIEELKEVIGQRHKIDFDSLNTNKTIEIEQISEDDDGPIGSASLGKDNVEPEDEF